MRRPARDHRVFRTGDEAANEAVKPFSQNDAHGDVHVVDIEAGHLRVPSPPPSPPAKVHPEPRSKAGKTASAGPLGEFIFIVLKGSLSAVDQKGQAVQANSLEPPTASAHMRHPLVCCCTMPNPPCLVVGPRAYSTACMLHSHGRCLTVAAP
eukprot:2965058-Prymnesium_polylepis.4